MKNVAMYLLEIFILSVFCFFTFSALEKYADESISNQDTMLCISAKQSGNVEYLKKCQCFYESGEPNCLIEK